MTHIELLRALIQMYSAPRYLEIGVGDGGCFRQLSGWCDEAHGVDVSSNPYGPDVPQRITSAPGHSFYWAEGSDKFFEEYEQMFSGRKFDVIFIDGNHYAEQVFKDWTNSLRVLSDRGTIALHDTWAATHDEALQGSDTAYQVAEMIESNPIFQAFTIPIRPGLTLARPHKPRFQ